MQRERRAFTQEFPRGAPLDTLVDAFERGDYARVRAEGRALIRSGAPEEVRRAAESLIARTNPDPLAILLLVLTGALLLVVSLFWVAYRAPPDAGAPRAPVEHVR